ncbi:MAG: hypothetical protein ACYTGZ_01880 [Planctomycetota bacterium]|jgi:hypothetical protein
MPALRVLVLVPALCAAVHGRPSKGAKPVDEPMRQVFDLSKEAEETTFVVVELPRGYWRRGDMTGWGKPRVTLGLGAEFKRVPLPSGPNENGGVTVEYRSGRDSSLHDALDEVFKAWKKKAKNVSPEPDEHKRRTLRVKNKKLKAVIWRWSCEHITTGQPITATAAACEVGDAILVLTGWELQDARDGRRRGRRRTFSTAGIFEDLLRLVTVTDKPPKARPVRFKYSDTYSNARYYLTGLLPAGLEQGGGPYPAGTSVGAFRRDEKGEVTARFRVTLRSMTKGTIDDEVEYVMGFVREKYKHVAEPRRIRAGGVPCYLIAYSDGEQRVISALFFAAGRIWTWSYLSKAKGEALEQELKAFEKQTLKSARIWWAKTG